jgi:hypothetical protein
MLSACSHNQRAPSALRTVAIPTIAGGTVVSDDFVAGFDAGRSIDGTPMHGMSDHRSITVRMTESISEGEFDALVRQGFIGIIDSQTTSELIYDRRGTGPEGKPYVSKTGMELDSYLFLMTSKSGEKLRVEITRPAIYGGFKYDVSLEPCVLICP